jgi:hypothetical protein
MYLPFEGPSNVSNDRRRRVQTAHGFASQSYDLLRDVGTGSQPHPAFRH